MRVLLINPWDGEVFPTPAIGYLQATLRANGVDVTAVDLSGAFKEQYDLVAVTFHSFSVKYARQIREYYKGHLICGGHHPSALPEQMISIGYDQVIIGEGEKAIMEIINGNTSKIIKGDLSDINTVPFPDYTGLDFSGDMGIPIISSRGCPFRCNFCASTHFWDHKYRARSADNVLNEISLRLSQGFKSWMFEDDNFTANRSRAADICSGISEMGKYEWQCASRAESLDDELCLSLKKAGCNTVWLGIESLSQESLDRCNKNTTVEKMIQGIKTAQKFGISTRNQFIVGLPGDTQKNVDETITNLRKNNISAGSNILWILPCTEAYVKAKQKGFSDEVYLQTGAPFYTYEQSFETLKYWASIL